MVNTPSLPVVAPLGDDDRDVFVPFVGLFSGIPRWRWWLRSIIPLDCVHLGPCTTQVHQEQFAAGEMSENLVGIPVAQEQVIVQAIPVVVDPLPPAEEFTEQFWFAKKTNSTQQKKTGTPCRFCCSI